MIWISFSIIRIFYIFLCSSKLFVYLIKSMLNYLDFTTEMKVQSWIFLYLHVYCTQIYIKWYSIYISNFDMSSYVYLSYECVVFRSRCIVHRNDMSKAPCRGIKFGTRLFRSHSCRSGCHVSVAFSRQASVLHT